LPFSSKDNLFGHVESNTFSDNFTGGESVKLALKEQDQDLNEISNLLGDMENISLQINDKLSQDEHDLERIHHKMDNVSNRVDNSNKRINKLL
jgi:methyl-accepting chemotaxis protein